MNKCSCPCIPVSLPSIPSNQGNVHCNSNTCSHQIFSNDKIQPNQEPPCQRIAPLNSLGIRLDGRYKKVTTPFSGCREGFVTFDNPNTYDPVRAIRTVFDRPNYTGEVNVGNVCHDEIYSPRYKNYGKNYRNYMDIDAGQIQYYINESQKDVYNSPNFVTPSVVKNSLFVDPNGIVKPEYERFPLTDYSWNKKCGKYDACDSDTHDTLEHRQDIMSRQQRKNNQQSWVFRWGDHVLRGE